MVMEATSDCWKPFYYLLEDLPGIEVVLVNARHVETCLVARPTLLRPHGWPNSARLVSCVARSCRSSRSGSCAT